MTKFLFLSYETENCYIFFQGFLGDVGKLNSILLRAFYLGNFSFQLFRHA